MLFWMTSELVPRNSVWVMIPEGEGAVLGEDVPDKPNTSNNCELDWCMQQHTTGADAWLQALEVCIIGYEVGVGLHTTGEVWYLRLSCFLIVSCWRHGEHMLPQHVHLMQLTTFSSSELILHLTTQNTMWCMNFSVYIGTVSFLSKLHFSLWVSTYCHYALGSG